VEVGLMAARVVRGFNDDAGLHHSRISKTGVIHEHDL
jgi:hypothetical protein